MWMRMILTALLMLGSACDDDDAPSGLLDGAVVGDEGDASVDAATRDVTVLETVVNEAGLDTGVNTQLPPDAGVTAQGLQVSLRESYTFGVGGLVTLKYAPVFLLPDGTACTDVQFSASDLGAEAHRAMYPATWTRWTRSGSKISIESNGKQVALSGLYAPLPKGLTLAGTWTFLTGGGNTALGGDVLIVATNTLTFFADGKFVLGKFAGVSSSSTAVVSQPTDQRGSYEIEGFRLTLRFEDGTVRRSSIITEASDTEVFWLGDKGYIKD